MEQKNSNYKIKWLKEEYILLKLTMLFQIHA